MRWTILAVLAMFLVVACGGDAADPADNGGNNAGSGESGDLATLKAPAGGGETPETEKKAPEPVDPAVALEEYANTAFSTDDPDVQIEALDKIFSSKADREKRARLIARALESSDDDVRSYAAEVIGKMEVPSIAHDLRSLLAKETVVVIRKNAVQSLYALAGMDAVTDLVKIVENTDEHYNVRAAACQLLGNSKNERGLKPLMKVLEEDFNDTVRREAVAALADMKAYRAEKLIIDALADSNALVRTEAAKALGVLKSKKAVGPLIEALDLDEEDEVQVLEAISRALGKIVGLGKEEMEDYLVTGNHSEAEKKAAVANWKEWWEENSGDYE